MDIPILFFMFFKYGVVRTNTRFSKTLVKLLDDCNSEIYTVGDISGTTTSNL